MEQGPSSLLVSTSLLGHNPRWKTSFVFAQGLANIGCFKEGGLCLKKESSPLSLNTQKSESARKFENSM